MADIPVHVCYRSRTPSPESVLSLLQKSLPGAIIYQAPSSPRADIEVSHCVIRRRYNCYELAAAGVAMVAVAAEEHQDDAKKSACKPRRSAFAW